MTIELTKEEYVELLGWVELMSDSSYAHKIATFIASKLEEQYENTYR